VEICKFGQLSESFRYEGVILGDLDEPFSSVC